MGLAHLLHLINYCLFTVLAALYHELDERGNEMENVEYQRKKVDDLQKRLADAHSSIHHIELVRAIVFLMLLIFSSIADILDQYFRPAGSSFIFFYI